MRRMVDGRDVRGHPVQMLQWNVELVTLSVLDREVLGPPLVLVLAAGTDEPPDAVLDVHDVVTRLDLR